MTSGMCRQSRPSSGYVAFLRLAVCPQTCMWWMQGLCSKVLDMTAAERGPCNNLHRKSSTQRTASAILAIYRQPVRAII